MRELKIEGKIVDIVNREIYSGSIEITEGVITAINRHPTAAKGFIMMGFIDSHLHIESSLLTPENFGELVVEHGTIGVVTDPHEIANVAGCEGIEYMIESSERAPIRVHFTIPSCVPATPFDLTGSTISPDDVEVLAASGCFVGLSEMMNVPGVLFGDESVHKILDSARKHNLVIDGHAPMLSGEDLVRYCSFGITTDHECTTIEEAREKIKCGMKILIREGSAAVNYESLKGLITTDPESVMFCTDDSHPDEIISDGHIDKIVRRAVNDGFDLFDVLRIASLNPIEHYGLRGRGAGVLEVGAAADFMVVEDLQEFRVRELYIGGEVKYSRPKGRLKVAREGIETINNFYHEPITAEMLRLPLSDTTPMIGLIEGEIVTSAESYTPPTETENFECDREADIAKLVYINRYHNSPPVVALIRGFGLKEGSVASSVSHDSHNIIAVGCCDRDIVAAVNRIIGAQGGLAVAAQGEVTGLDLPIAGIMSDLGADAVALSYSTLQKRVRELGSPLDSPFMTLSFMSLVVIPELKIGEKGLFSYSKFGWI